ncbi:MAG: hypothetical protein A3B69_04345 [Gammaproteobacteria bacterium RIFCSPHIGHO2_02_FULL_38_33]|nr:MAG: hypothetical protein A3B69_04345 [Gammaproteobacteria bacterium RIFCSPHIGHO2_02_FULL_38_33]
MTTAPKKIRSLYFSSLKLSFQLYPQIKLLFLGILLIGIVFHFSSYYFEFKFILPYSKQTLLFFSFISFIFYSFIACLIFNIHYKKITSYAIAFKQSIKIQKKLWQGIFTFMLPFLLSVLLTKIAPHFPKDKTFFILLFYSTGLFLIIWGILYFPMVFIYLFALLREPSLSFKESINYTRNLCLSNWWRIVISTISFYMVFFIIFDLVSHFYIFHIDKNHVILSNLIMMCVIFYFFYPILISFSLLLTDDLQSRNNLCDVTKNK